MPGWPKPGEDFPPPTAPGAGRAGRRADHPAPAERAARPTGAVGGPARRSADVRRSPTCGPRWPRPARPMRSERETMPGIDRASAVLAPLYEHDGELFVVLTRRTWEMRAHSGEVSFPGGRQDDGEDLWATALREAHEEIALDAGRRSSRSASSTTSPPSRAARSSSPTSAALPGRPDDGGEPAARCPTVLHVPRGRAARPGHLPRGALDVPVGRGPPDLLLRAGRRHRVGRHRRHAPPARSAWSPAPSPAASSTTSEPRLPPAAAVQAWRL